MRLLGRGAMGQVYLAHDTVLDRLVAVKFVTRHQNSAARMRFLIEARAAARVQHGNVVTVHRVGELDERPYIVSEFVRGTSLNLLDKPVAWQRALQIGIGLARGLAAAHQHGVLHRDIKPANTILRETGEAVLVDFGLAKLAEVDSSADLELEASVQQSGDSTLSFEDDGVAATVAAAADVSGDAEPVASASDATAEPARPVGGRGAELATLSDGGSGPAPPSSTGKPRSVSRPPTFSPSLTRAGAILGTPYYMSPETWRGEVATSRSDVYSLGVLLYELVVGHPPHRGVTPVEVARRVVDSDAPPISQSVVEVDASFAAIIHRCLSRDAEARYASADGLREALESLADIGRPLPRLDEVLRDELVAEAPFPLAEAVALLDGSRNVHQARLAVRQVARAAVRYLGVLALASRSRVGAGHRGDSETVVEAVRKLRRRGLDEAQWLSLARELCQPFAGRAEVHPVPELVELVAGSQADELAAMIAELVDEADASHLEDEAHHQLEARLPVLAELLARLRFLSRYLLVVPRGLGVERWMGARRTSRALLSSAPGSFIDNRPLLVDRTGKPVLSLWPLAQVAAPNPGAAAELFLLAGGGRRGARMVAMPTGFEREDEEPWQWLRDNLLSDASASEGLRQDSAAPYRGLAPFTAADAGLFFGREREAESFRNRLLCEPMMAIIGPSGAGKSSFIQAGVIPDLPADWRVVVMRPGAAPLAGLIAGLAMQGSDPEGLRAELEGDPHALARHLAALNPTGKCVLVIDQLEELFTLCLDDGERDSFVATLATLQHALDDSLRLVFTLRDDFLFRAEQHAGLRPALTQGLWLLGTPARSDLVRILTEPALRSGYEFEDGELPAEMVAEVADKPGALALLSFTASVLWEVRDRHFKRLTRKSYEAIGGVGGALAQHAEETLARRSKEERRLVRQAFRRLITAEGTRAVITLPELIEVLGDEESARAIIERLVNARLLVITEADDGAENVEIIHEALLSAWPRLLRWQREDIQGARLRDQLRAAANQWADRGRPSGLLWRGDALAEYRLWRSRHDDKLTEVESEFALASVADAARGRRVRRLVVGGVFIILAAATVLLFTANRRTGAARHDAELAQRAAEASAREAQRRLADQYQEQGRQKLLAGEPLLAMLYLDEAHSQGAHGFALEYMASTALRAFEPEVAVLRGHTDGLSGILVSRDGNLIATASADGTVRLWDGEGRFLRSLAAHVGVVVDLALSPDGTRVATAGVDRTVRIWDVAAGNLLATLSGHLDMIKALTFSPDGKWLATASYDGTARLWSAAGAEVAVLRGHARRVLSVAFDPTSSRLVTTSTDGTARIWAVPGGAAEATLVGHGDLVTMASFSSTGARLVTAGIDKTARIWDAASGDLLLTLEGHRGAIEVARFIAGDTRVVTASGDYDARIWDAVTGKTVAILGGHTGRVTDVIAGCGDELLVTISTDATIKAWEAGSGALVTTLYGHNDRVRSAAFMPGCRRLVSASTDNTARIWELVDPYLLASFRHSDSAVLAVGYGGDGEYIISAGIDGSAKVWESKSRRVTATLAGHERPVYGAVISRAGDLAVTASTDGTARLWELPGGRLRHVLASGEKYMSSVDISPDGELIVTSGASASPHIWSARTGKQLRSLSGHSARVEVVGFSPDGRRVATASEDDTVRIWEVKTGAELASLSNPTASRLAFSPEGKLLVVGGRDRTAHVWDLEARQVRVSLDGHTELLTSVGFSPDGRVVITSSEDGTARLWDAKSGALLQELRHPILVHWASFDPTGLMVVTGCEDGLVRVWDVAVDPTALDSLTNAVRCRVPYRLDNGRLLRTSVSCPPR